MKFSQNKGLKVALFVVKKGAISCLKIVAHGQILSPFWRQIAPSGHPGLSTVY